MELQTLASWNDRVPAFVDGRLDDVLQRVSRDRQSYPVFPAESDVLRTFALTAFSDVKVVLLGQDPYHKKGQANGLAFSVPEGISAPPSLRNIFKERSAEGYSARSTDLTDWAEQGVLLLNSVLTVREGVAASHRGMGWQDVTGDVISKLGERERPMVFLLWGNHAQKLGERVTNPVHRVFHAPHPSPLAAYRGFFGSRPFSNTNAVLQKWGEKPIEW